MLSETRSQKIKGGQNLFNTELDIERAIAIFVICKLTEQ